MTANDDTEIVKDVFGLSLASLFSAVSGRNPQATFSEKKVTFFSLLTRLLNGGRMMFIVPGADCYVSSEKPTSELTIYDAAARWTAPTNEIVQFISERWPSEVNNDDDIELLIYFYTLPGLIWVTDDGEFISS
jgi:hypothetical protein